MTARNEYNVCRDLHKYLDRDLLESARYGFEQHLTECRTCTAAIAQWTTFAGAARNDATQQAFRSPAAEHIAQKQLEASFSQQQALSPWHRRSFAPLMATAVVLVCLLAGAAIFWTRANDPSPKQTAPVPSTVQITRFSMDGSIRQTTGHQGTPIAATPNEQLLATVGKDRVAVAPKGRMVIKRKETTSTLLALNDGWIACQVAKRHGSRQFVTRTQDKRFTVVVKGTRFGVQYQGSSDTRVDELSPLLQVAVTEGIGQVEETQGRTWTVSAAEQLVVQPSGAAEVMPISEQNRTIVSSLLNPSSAPSALTDILAQPNPALDSSDKASPPPALSRGTKTKSSPGVSPGIPRPDGPDASPVSVAEMRQWIGAGRNADAIAVIEARLLKEPGNSELWRLLAESKRKVGDYQGAIVAYQQVIDSASPQMANAARYKMGLIYQNQLHQPANAITQFSRYLADGEPQLLRAEALYHLGRAEYNMGHKASARAHLNEVTEQHSATAAAVQARKLLQQMDL
ncbi:MAG: tetratricopeptide repeat protein [Deltaproteobacteria bacterium]|nr:tetratricopeptide repeat protein [Deltaproteobacteria bacterium]